MKIAWTEVVNALMETMEPMRGKFLFFGKDSFDSLTFQDLLQNGISNAKTKEEKEKFYLRLVARMDLLCFLKLGDYFSFISDFNLGRIREYFIFHVDFQESEDVESCETTQYKEYTR